MSGNDTQAIRKWNSDDTAWMVTLFGTAVGAGILFLPINAGLGGIWPLIFMTLLIGPMTFLSHRGLSRVCLTSPIPDGDITDAVRAGFGESAGRWITLGYFLAIYPIVMIYGIGLTNTVTSLMENQLGMDAPPRLILSGVLVIGLVLIMLSGKKVVLKVTEAIVFPLIGILAFVSLYLVPQWSLAHFDTAPTVSGFLITVLLTLPVLVFAFNHSPAVSTFSSDYRSREGAGNAEPLASRTLKRTSMLLVGFVMFFVFSCVLTLTPEELASAKANSLPTLSLFAQRSGAGWFGWLAQIIAIVAITSSFFGHYMGTAEGLHGLIVQGMRRNDPNRAVDDKKIRIFVILFIILTVWAVAYANVSVMGMIENLVAPILALILYIMPVVATRKVPAMHKYRSAADIFTFSMGVITITGFIIANFIM